MHIIYECERQPLIFRVSSSSSRFISLFPSKHRLYSPKYTRTRQRHGDDSHRENGSSSFDTESRGRDLVQLFSFHGENEVLSSTIEHETRKRIRGQPWTFRGTNVSLFVPVYFPPFSHRFYSSSRYVELPQIRQRSKGWYPQRRNG